MDNANKLSTLQERAIIQLAVNLCQENSVKELVLCLEKPTYGYIYHNLFFMSDQKNLSIWAAKMRELPSNQIDCSLSYHTYVGEQEDDCSLSYHRYVREQQDAALEKECQRLTEELPYLLRDRVRTWIKRIALEFQSFRCRLELLFGVSRYILMTFFSIRDWKETGRLDEKKLALRLLEDERLTVFQKYQIACVYCLHVHIPKLWKRLTREEISLITEDLKLFRERIRSGELMPYEDYKTHVSVLLWSYQMEGKRKKKLTKRELWTYASEQATYYGNRPALALCWERLNEQTRQQIVVDWALISLKECVKKGDENLLWRIFEHFEENSRSYTELPKNVFDLRSHHAELMLFFLSKMDEEQKLTFFKRVFSEYELNLKCFLDWPLQHELFQMINRLEGIMTNDIYRECMLSLAEKCSENSTKENHIDDYRNLFCKLWETTPEELKQYVFNSNRHSCHLLYFLLKRSPFLKEDEALFNRVFSDMSQEDRREMMLCNQGEQFILKLLKQKRWPFLNWFLEECLSKEEIPNIKKKFIKSGYGCNWCLANLGENRESLVQDVIDWCFEYDSEKSQFKCELMNTENCDNFSVRLNLQVGNFAEVERMINFCVSSHEMKKEIKGDLALCVCKDLFRQNPEAPEWEEMDRILSWSLASDDKIRDIKNCLLYQDGIDTHYEIVFVKKNWEELERFYKWFDLSPEEIEDHKHIIFNDRYLIHIIYIISEFLFDAKELVAPLRWFLTDEKKVISFKERLLEGIYAWGELEDDPKEWLDYLECELLRGLKKEKNQNKTSRGGTFVKNKGEKRSSVAIEDESNSRSKRCMRLRSRNKQ